VACLLSIYTYFIFDDAKVQIFCDMTKQSMEHSKNFPERFGLHDYFSYLCTYESQQMLIWAHHMPHAYIGIVAISHGPIEPKDEISWWEILYLALYPQG
jgi:hypothetical protein